MESEKVKEIKKALEQNDDNGIMYEVNDQKRTCKFIHHKDILTLINELESENEMLQNKNYQLEQDLGQCENGYKLELHTARYQLHSANEDLKKAEKRIAELEEGNKEQLKQFAERLKEKLKDNVNAENVDNFVECKRLMDEILKEFL